MAMIRHFVSLPKILSFCVTIPKVRWYIMDGVFRVCGIFVRTLCQRVKPMEKTLHTMRTAAVAAGTLFAAQAMADTYNDLGPQAGESNDYWNTTTPSSLSSLPAKLYCGI